jgi:hypothetical protein
MISCSTGQLSSGAVPPFAPSPVLARLERTRHAETCGATSPSSTGSVVFSGAGPTPRSNFSVAMSKTCTLVPRAHSGRRGVTAKYGLDGEIVIADDCGGSDFGALPTRLGVAKRDATQIARERPAGAALFRPAHPCWRRPRPRSGDTDRRPDRARGARESRRIRPLLTSRNQNYQLSAARTLPCAISPARS